jgi:UDP-glucose 4-epimerase
MRIAVTGAAGYIGGETVLRLRDAGHEVYGCDVIGPSSSIAKAAHHWTVADFASGEWLWTLDKNPVDALVHCAGTSLVGPSMSDPDLYYQNNFVKTKILLDHLRERSPHTRFVFSSSASVYGNPVMVPCQEVDPIMPISPYGESKAMIEWMLASYQRAYGTQSVVFRYFNACGADSENRHGQAPGATHIIARVLESIRDDRPFTMFGRDYPTKDGTCVRDYVHVQDIADAHVMACEGRIPADVYNLGSNRGYSNQEIVNIAQHVTGRTVQIVDGAARAGDPADLVASVDHVHRQSAWRAKWNVHDIIQHAWAWYTR